jgi:hypothetical protein
VSAAPDAVPDLHALSAMSEDARREALLDEVFGDDVPEQINTYPQPSDRTKQVVAYTQRGRRSPVS